MSVDARIVAYWLTGFRVEYIARVERVSVDYVSRVVAKAIVVPTGAIGERTNGWQTD